MKFGGCLMFGFSNEDAVFGMFSGGLCVSIWEWLELLGCVLCELKGIKGKLRFVFGMWWYGVSE